MKKLLFILLLIPILQTFGQNVGIGTSSPHASASLHIESTTRGFLPPRLTIIQRDAISSPATGLFIFNADKECFQYYKGSNWSNCLAEEQANNLLCISKVMNGIYSIGQVLDGTNTIEIDIYVVELGAYTISSDLINGYSFTTSGTFVALGYQTVTIPGSGTPVLDQTDNFTLSITNSTSICNIPIIVNPSRLSCLSHLNAGNTTSGIYSLDPDGAGGDAPFDCYCDMTTDGGGWTLVTSSLGEVQDHATAHYSDLTTLTPTAAHSGLWDKMRPVAGPNSDIRFSARIASSGALDVDLAFYDCTWYDVLTASTSESAVCFADGGSTALIWRPARKNILTGASLVVGDTYNSGELEGEDACGETNDFTLDFDDRGMDSNQTDGTDWGIDDNSQKCGSVQGGTYYFFIWVRE